MNNNCKEIESVFRNSTSSDELFDAFSQAINLKIVDLELYKILLANPVISSDEIKMYTEKLLRELPESSCRIYMWTANVFESRSPGYSNFDDIILYYQKAISFKPTEVEPFLNLLKLYNYDVEILYNGKIMDIVENGIGGVKVKSKIYYALSDLFKKLNNNNTAARYLALAEKSAELERM